MPRAPRYFQPWRKAWVRAAAWFLVLLAIAVIGTAIEKLAGWTHNFSMFIATVQFLLIGLGWELRGLHERYK